MDVTLSLKDSSEFLLDIKIPVSIISIENWKNLMKRPHCGILYFVIIYITFVLHKLRNNMVISEKYDSIYTSADAMQYILWMYLVFKELLVLMFLENVIVKM